MQQISLRVLGKLARMVSLILFAALGSLVLTRYAPGYFTDHREMEAAYAEGARAQLRSLEQDQGSLPTLLRTQLRDWVHGDLGRSRHYGIPVADLVRGRSAVTMRLLLSGIGTGWLVALTLALLMSARRTSHGELVLAAFTAALLAVPVGALATLSLVLDKGGPVTVLALLIAVRDFKLLYRLLRMSWAAPHVLHARAQGFSFLRTARVHLAPVLARELLALAIMSLVVALSALVPVEVVFDMPGLGQLAWTSAMNRDLPALVAVTTLMAVLVGAAGLFVSPERSTEVAQCA